jgi:DNA-binding LytR/AlgR family response regulator
MIVEDEPLAIGRLRDCVAYLDEVTLIGEARDGLSAIKMIDLMKPDLLFLDIQLPLKSGFDVLRTVRYVPGVIFTTAHNEYAVSAFEWGAFDYLLKPFDKERVALALSRFKKRSGHSSDGDILAERLNAIESNGELRRFFVQQRGYTVPLETDCITAILAERDYCRIYVEDESYLIHLPLRECEKRLNTALFLRVHRSALINTSKVLRIEAAGRGAQILMDGGMHVRASRAGLTHLKALRL